MNQLHILPCLDSAELAVTNRQALNIPRHLATDLGRSAVAVSRAGSYRTTSGMDVNFSHLFEAAKSSRLSIAPKDPLPSTHPRAPFPETRIQVTNETTLVASRRLADRGLRPLALNFANGINPGGGFLDGARAQEETLCRSSALYLTLVGDRMYEEHARLRHCHSSDWCILSPDVPVFRQDDGTPLDSPWLLSMITCAAPVCKFPPEVIAELLSSESADLTYTALVLLAASEASDALQDRIHRVLAVAKAFGYETLVLGAWGCGAFGNDPERTAADFRDALETEFRGAFSEIVFAITDWSPERKFLGPFRDAFTPSSGNNE